MAIYRLSAQLISRADGRSSVAAAAYRAGVAITDLKTGLVHDFSRRRGVVHHEIMAPHGTPDRYMDRAALWNDVEINERRKDSQLCREIQLALPHEVGQEQQLALVRKFVQREFISLGMIADVAVHYPHQQGRARNDHCHILLSLRRVDAEGFGQKERSWNDRSLLERWRRVWAEETNELLKQAGISQKLDHRSLLVQQKEAQAFADAARAANDNERASSFEMDALLLGRLPAPKLGYAATAMERRGIRTERGDHWRVVMQINATRLAIWGLAQRNRLQAVWLRLQRWHATMSSLTSAAANAAGHATESQAAPADRAVVIATVTDAGKKARRRRSSRQIGQTPGRRR